MWVESFDTGARHAARTRETGEERATSDEAVPLACGT